MCMCSQCDSTSLPVQRSQILFFICVLAQFKHADSKEIASAVLVPLGDTYSLRHICSGDISSDIVYFDSACLNCFKSPKKISSDFFVPEVM